MPKILFRIVALLLVPCLIADPSRAAAFYSSCTARTCDHHSQKDYFQQEAVVPVIRRIPSILLKSGIDQARQEAVISRLSNHGWFSQLKYWANEFESVHDWQTAEGPSFRSLPRLHRKEHIQPIQFAENQTDHNSGLLNEPLVSPGPSKNVLERLLATGSEELATDPSLGKVLCIESLNEPFKNRVTQEFIVQLAQFSATAFGSNYLDAEGFIDTHADEFSSPGLFYVLLNPTDGRLTGYLWATPGEGKTVVYLPRMATLQTDSVRGRGRLLLTTTLRDLKRRKYSQVRFDSTSASLVFYLRTLENIVDFVMHERRFTLFLTTLDNLSGAARRKQIEHRTKIEKRTTEVRKIFDTLPPGDYHVLAPGIDQRITMPGPDWEENSNFYNFDDLVDLFVTESETSLVTVDDKVVIAPWKYKDKKASTATKKLSSLGAESAVIAGQSTTGRLKEINDAIITLERATGVDSFSMSHASKEAIVRTYLNNPQRSISPATIVPRPLLDNAPDMERAQRWIAAYPPELQDLARFLLAHLTYVNQNEFEKALEETLGKLQSALGSRPYAEISWFNDSHIWVRNLAIEKGLRPPTENVLFVEKNRSTEEAVKKALSQGIRDFVIFDDASHTGNQVNRIIEDLMVATGDREDVHIHVAVPYISTIATKIMPHQHGFTVKGGWRKRVSNPQRKNIFLYHSRTLRTLSELLKSAPKPRSGSTLLSLANDVYGKGRVQVNTLTYFQHKIPDSLSIFSSIVDDVVRKKWTSSARKDPRTIVTAEVPFIDSSLPAPYNEANPEFIKERVLERSPRSADATALAMIRGVAPATLAFLLQHGLRLQWVSEMDASQSDAFRNDPRYIAERDDSAKYPAAVHPIENTTILVQTINHKENLNFSIMHTAWKRLVRQFQIVEKLLSLDEPIMDEIIHELADTYKIFTGISHEEFGQNDGMTYRQVPMRQTLERMIVKGATLWFTDDYFRESNPTATAFFNRNLAESA